MKTTSSGYDEYGATDKRESLPLAVTPDKSSSSGAIMKEGRHETALPLHHTPLNSLQTEVQTSDTFIWSTPTKNNSSRVNAYRGENTPSTATSLDYASSESSISPSRRGHIDQKEADEIRLSINFERAQHIRPPKSLESNSKQEVLVQIFLPKFVLEVMGGAGAVWGFSEAVGLRTSANLWFWRPVTLFAGALFFIRWCRQLQGFRRSHHDVRAGQRLIGIAESETIALMQGHA